MLITRSYLDSVAANLLQTLSEKTRHSFENGSGQELRGTPSRPSKMKTLHSSSALTVNVFDYWVERAPPLPCFRHISTGVHVDEMLARRKSSNSESQLMHKSWGLS
jgi:hypothetical protein